MTTRVLLLRACTAASLPMDGVVFRIAHAWFNGGMYVFLSKSKSVLLLNHQISALDSSTMTFLALFQTIIVITNPSLLVEPIHRNSLTKQFLS